ncbi:hypothetical protein fugu_013067 [Takifugu bimaculatus]|uniref:Uncharacterized protein n=1 Tax=Takifugu bimaculatus TaxID=433685 RepID=A0A4Z2C731_9TELE|nr:hypothetical protein fugu_013067 [Takifugu bimaculatus]
MAHKQEQSTKGERINKETGELTASGELLISEPKAGKEESSCKSCQLPQGLSEQLKELGIHACSSPKQTRDHVPLEQREELLDKVLPLYIQVCEDGKKLDVNVKGLAALSADTIISKIHSKVAERPAEGARDGVVHFLQRRDVKQANM